MLFNTKLFMFTLFCFTFKTSLSQKKSGKVEKCDFNILFFLNVLKVPPPDRWKLPAGFESTPEIIRREGFGYEGYRGVTEDGYILTYHRVITNRTGGQPVLFIHGLFMSSDGWLMTGRKNDIALQLADAGYDVWLGDHRGNWYSREHIRMKPDRGEYWEFSFHEHGIYDLAFFIDAVINATGYKQIVVYAVSMGCNEILALQSLRPEYNAKIKVTLLFSPVVVVIPLKKISNRYVKFISALLSKPMYNLMKRLNLVELFPRTYKFTETLRKCCNPKTGLKICLDLIGFGLGDNRENYNMTMIDDVIVHFPAGASLQTVYHMLQIFRSGKFELFDYGPTENLRRYKSRTPPLYPLEKVTTPVGIYWSGNDDFVTQKEIDYMANKFPNTVDVYKVPDPKYAHMDFIWGKNTRVLLNDRAIQFMESVL